MNSGFDVNSILCIDFSGSFCRELTEPENDTGLEIVICRHPGEAQAALDGTKGFALMIVNNSDEHDETCLQFLDHARRQSSRSTMPIAYVIGERNLDLAHRAFQAGATEVIQRRDTELIRQFIHEATRADQKMHLAGRILLVEDEICQARHMQEICYQQGIAVDHCTSMEEGLERLQKTDYQIAVIDILLEGLNSGLMLVRHIRQMPGTRAQLPVLVISGYTDAARRIEALRAGADDFLAKPFAEEEFVWRLKKIAQTRYLNGNDIQRIALPDPSSWQQLGLSSRESEICDALIRGLNDKQIALNLNISFWTVRTHITKIFTKLGVLNRKELMARHLPSIGN